jgi:hypothetical protein
MKTLLLSTAVVCTVTLMGSRVFGQEVITTPNPAATTQADPAADVNPGDPPQAPVAQDPGSQSPGVPGPDGWRYRWSGGRWWYWTPAKRWMWYSDDGQWVDAEPTPPPPAFIQPPAVIPPGYAYPGYYGPYAYPGYYRGYYRGYYPGVPVVVGPYGNVNVGVGRRVGVDVWGGHGSVRVGRIGVGW